MDIVLSKNSEEPIYTQIYKQISRQILNGQLKSDTQLPPIRTVATELRISVIPVKMAWEELDRNGFIKTVVGKGTFVAELSEHNINEKKSEKAKLIAKEAVEKAIAEGLTADEFIELVKEEFKGHN